MADLTEELYQYVSGLAGANVHFGSPPRVFQLVAQKGTAFPYVVIRRTNESGAHYMGGTTRLGQAVIEFEIHAVSYKAARDAADWLRVNLDGLVGQRMGTRSIRFAMLQGQVDDYIDRQDGSQTPETVISMDFEFSYFRATTL